MRRKACPQCAERVGREAKVCRFCGHQFIQSPIIATETWHHSGKVIAGAVGLIALVGTVLLTYAVWSDLQATRSGPPASVSDSNPFSDLVPSERQSELEVLDVGATLEWIAENSLGEIKRQAGPYALTVSRRNEDELAAPIVKLTVGSQVATLQGEMASSGYSHRISLITNRAGAVPVVMLQSFTGGAHCCNHVQLAGLSQGALKVVDLGLWDGDQIEKPVDVNDDGVSDFVMRDNAFLYAFASYASSYAPPKILNIVGGKVVDVSKQPAFRKFYAEEMTEAGEVCRHGDSGDQRNGACPAYVAAAARLGRVDKAWQDMLSAYDASTDWDFPTGCRIKDKDTCPAGLEIQFKSYPEALLFFLKQEGYMPSGWQPPESFTPTEDSDASHDWTA